ncbi:MAG: phytanoyl-CoA dioxygenase family protein [Planctomycetota bacterium]|nr:phytanoyl-CoA dioxygenase family protein [Planctomycetota bacterium]MDA1141356.1 phytanoyl-CoA dioxygenase family protein [Planctomycetota bacterium]
MTPQEKYIFDIRGYLIIEDVIEPDYLEALNDRLDRWEEKAMEKRSLPASRTHNSKNVCFFEILNEEPLFLDLVTNPKILPYVDAMVHRPIVEQFSACFRWKGGDTGVHAGHTPYQAINSYQVSEGRIYNNHLRVVYAMKDIGPGEGGIQIVPGSHKANLRWEGVGHLPDMEPSVRELFVELTMKAGSALLFTHDAIHASINESEKVRRLIHTAYNFGLFARGWLADHADYERLFNEAPEGTWLKYLLRRPEYMDLIPKPDLEQ